MPKAKRARSAAPRPRGRPKVYDEEALFWLWVFVEASARARGVGPYTVIRCTGWIYRAVGGSHGTREAARERNQRHARLSFLTVHRRYMQADKLFRPMITGDPEFRSPIGNEIEALIERIQADEGLFPHK